MENHKSAEDGVFRRSGRFVGQSSFLIIYVTALTVLLAGLWTAKQSGQNADLQMRRDLVRQATDIAATIDPSAISTLSFTAADKTRPEFQRLCSQMRSYAEAAGLSSLYTLGLLNGQIVFGPESLAEGHPYASPPGTVYEEPSQKDFELFGTGSPQIQGPRSDEYGTFVTASAPVFDPRTGAVLAAIGIDVEASAWRAVVRRAQWMPGGATFVLLIILLFNWLILKHRHHHSSQQTKRKRHAEPVLCTLFIGALTLVLAVGFHQAEHQSRQKIFYSLAHSYAAASIQEFQEFRSIINQLVYFFESSQDVNREEFSAYCKAMVQQSTLQACIWLPAVPETAAGSFVQTVRVAGLPDFSIWQKNKKGISEPVSPRPVYYPASYIAPQAGYEAGLGYDMNSEPVRSAAIQEALRTGLSTATDPVRFIAPTNSPPGILIFSPVNAAVQKGLVAFIVCPENLLGGAQYHHNKNKGLNICLAQLRPGAEPFIVAGSSCSCSLSCFDEVEPGLRITVPVFQFGKAYALRLIPDPSWLAAHPLKNGRIVGAFGALITLLISFVVTLITNRRINLEKLVERRTAELQISEERFRDIVTNASDWAWEVDVQGRYSYASEKSKDVLGYPPSELIGKTPFDLMPPEEAAKAKEMFTSAAKDHKPFRDYENWCVCADGRLVCLLTSGVPAFSNDGTFIGYRGTDSDITVRKQAEEALHAKLDELQRWQAVTLGREGRVCELKREVNVLAARLGLPPPYGATEFPT